MVQRKKCNKHKKKEKGGVEEWPSSKYQDCAPGQALPQYSIILFFGRRTETTEDRKSSLEDNNLLGIIRCGKFLRTEVALDEGISYETCQKARCSFSEYLDKTMF